ncbi:DUF1827 family protein [Streptococcus sp. DD13]|uniref:DUF1827 family protein n=1 Tax=Streptococcus sp. DD13 TaxID=1777881 RepID=UPI000797545B|nr:DUF1827 family protein [Streptococcus sp. DD13]KXT79228.1 hypothetical protein STRDD13_00052 [Streptococcus sp. DD13]
MKLINTTNSRSELVRNQLANTDANLIETFSAGNTDVIFTQAPKHYEILISNKHRAIQESEVETIREYFLRRKIKLSDIDPQKIQTIYTKNIIEISIPCKEDPLN